MPTSPIVANIVYRIVPFGKILAEELFIPSSVIYSLHLRTYLFEEVTSEIFSQGIFPFCQYVGLLLSGVPPADTKLKCDSLTQHHVSGISKGISSSIFLTSKPTFS